MRSECALLASASYDWPDCHPAVPDNAFTKMPRRTQSVDKLRRDLKAFLFNFKGNSCKSRGIFALLVLKRCPFLVGLVVFLGWGRVKVFTLFRVVLCCPHVMSSKSLRRESGWVLLQALGLNQSHLVVTIFLGEDSPIKRNELSSFYDQWLRDSAQ